MTPPTLSFGTLEYDFGEYIFIQPRTQGLFPLEAIRMSNVEKRKMALGTRLIFIVSSVFQKTPNLG